jgi:hypothetical protein
MKGDGYRFRRLPNGASDRRNEPNRDRDLRLVMDHYCKAFYVQPGSCWRMVTN